MATRIFVSILCVLVAFLGVAVFFFIGTEFPELFQADSKIPGLLLFGSFSWAVLVLWLSRNYVMRRSLVLKLRVLTRNERGVPLVFLDPETHIQYVVPNGSDSCDVDEPVIKADSVTGIWRLRVGRWPIADDAQVYQVWSAVPEN